MTTRNYRDPLALVGRTDSDDTILSLVDVFSFVRPFIKSTAESYTTSGRAAHETVKFTVASPQTLTIHSDPTDGQRITVKRRGAGSVTISGAIDGGTSVVVGSGAAVNLVYIDDSVGEWAVV